MKFFVAFNQSLKWNVLPPIIGSGSAISSTELVPSLKPIGERVEPNYKIGLKQNKKLVESQKKSFSESMNN